MISPARRARPGRARLPRRISAFVDLYCAKCGDTRHYLQHQEGGDIYRCPICHSWRPVEERSTDPREAK